VKEDAMRLYLQEADRQIRVYGMASSPSNNPEDGGTSTPRLEDGNRNAYGTDDGSPGIAQPRGLAAIPLLCAAASESRQAYLTRLAHTEPHQAWWQRQEPLCATPGSFWALPETILLFAASLVETISLAVDDGQGHGTTPIPPTVVQSFLWPVHNTLLALWMGIILDYTLLVSCYELIQILLWGSRRTGLSLLAVWRDEIQWSATQINTMTESNQPLTARLVGLACLPNTMLVGIVNALVSPGQVPASVLFVFAVIVTWWYWSIVLPMMAAGLIFFSLVAGGNFALIELAGV
jgi:hypothetical protein